MQFGGNKYSYFSVLSISVLTKNLRLWTWAHWAPLVHGWSLLIAFSAGFAELIWRGRCDRPQGVHGRCCKTLTALHV